MTARGWAPLCWLCFVALPVSGAPDAGAAAEPASTVSPQHSDEVGTYDEVDGGGSAPTLPAEQNTRLADVQDPVHPATVAGPAAPRLATTQTLSGRLMGLVGCLVLIAIAIMLSTNRRKIPWRLVGMGTGLQVLFAWVVLKTSVGVRLFEHANGAVKKLLSFSEEGARFVFGNLVQSGVPVRNAAGDVTGQVADVGAFVAFNLMPTILFFSALSALLYHLGVLQRLVRLLAGVMRRTMGTSGAESLAAAANIFVGQTEAPLLIRPYLERMTRSELMAVMTGGFATVAGGVLAVYVGFLEPTFPDIAGHLLAASVMSAPASLVMAKVMVPETEEPETKDGAQHDAARTDANVLDATARGISDGVKLAANVAAMLIGFMALLPLLNWILTWPGIPFEWVGLTSVSEFFFGLTLQKIMGVFMAPLAFVLGVPWEDASAVGSMMGAKTVINEFVAYLDLTRAMQTGTLQHGKSVVIATYALCGFSNLGSIGIQIGGLSVMAPSRRKDLASLGPRAMVAASLACFQTAALAGMML